MPHAAVTFTRHTHAEQTARRLIGGFAFFTVLCALLHLGKVLYLTYTPLALLVGAYLFFCKRSYYTGFVIWMWVLTPLIRRIADLYTSYHSISIIVLAPLGVTGICYYNVMQTLPVWNKKPYRNLYLILFCLLWGLLIGIITSSPVAAVYGFLNWSVPVAFAFHLYVNHRQIQEYHLTLFRHYGMALIVLSVYGLYQFLVLPSWDRFWVSNVDMHSIGWPLPLLVHTFSTINSPAAFATYLMIGLFCLVADSVTYRWPKAVLGLIAIMISIIRTAWGGLVCGMLFFYLLSEAKNKLKYILICIVVIALMIPLLTMFSPVATLVSARMDSFSDIQNDVSFQARKDLYENFGTILIQNYFSPGEGLGTSGTATKLTGENSTVKFGIDSGFLTLISTFGVVSAIFLFVIITQFMKCIFLRARDKNKLICHSAYFALFLMLASLNDMTGSVGMLFWTFFALIDIQPPKLQNIRAPVHPSASVGPQVNTVLNPSK